MRILLFTDTHSSKSHIEAVKKKALNADLVICLGDFTMFQAYMKSFLREINSMGKTVLMIPGNHESEDELKDACKGLKNIFYIHKNHYEMDGLLFLGYGTGGFAYEDLVFENIAKKWEKMIKGRDKVILLTHQPPYNTLIDVVGKNHAGNMSFRRFIDKYKPVLAASGHLHENFYKTQKIGKTIVLNPGPSGRIVIIK